MLSIGKRGSPSLHAPAGVWTPLAFLHRGSLAGTSPKYNVAIIYANSIFIVVGFAHLRSPALGCAQRGASVTSGMLREGSLGQGSRGEGKS